MTLEIIEHDQSYSVELDWSRLRSLVVTLVSVFTVFDPATNSAMKMAKVG